jgi:hypothetical protein
VRAAAAKGPARIAACQPSGCLSTPHRPAGNRMDSSATFASMPKPHIAVAARKAKSHLSSKTARPVVAICRTWREVHAEISTHRSTPSRIANTVIRSVSLNDCNVRGLEDSHKHKRSTGSRLQFRCECELTGRSECGPARCKRSVVAVQQLGPLQASNEHSAGVPECGWAALSIMLDSRKQPKRDGGA